MRQRPRSEDGIQQFLTSLFGNAPRGKRIKHLHSGAVINIQKDRAECRSDVVVLEAHETAPWSIQATNRHVDVLIRDSDGTWRFLKKQVVETRRFGLNR